MPTFQHEVVFGVSALTMWDTLKEQNTLFPKLMPEMVASIEMLEGAGEPGSVRLIKFTPLAQEMNGFGFVKEKLVSLDLDNHSLVGEELDGGHKALGFTKWAHTMKFVPIDDKSSKLAFSAEYEGGAENGVDTVIAKAKEGISKTFKIIEEHAKKTSA